MAEEMAEDMRSAGCHRFSEKGADHAKDSRIRAQHRKEKLRAWAEEAQTKLDVGAVVKVLRTIRYKWSTDVSKHYELPRGLQGTVIKIDADGDAEVEWLDVDVGRRWILSKDFYKVHVEIPAPPKPPPPKEPVPKAESYFEVGEDYVTRSAVILRAGEDIESEWRGELAESTRVTLLQIGTTHSRRVRVRCEGTGAEGWISKLTQHGTLLMGRVNPVCCPKGHNLQLITEVTRGRCDQCTKEVSRGDQVMDCSVCNWYLCGTCHPHEKARSTTVRQDLIQRRAQRRSTRIARSSMTTSATAAAAAKQEAEATREDV